VIKRLQIAVISDWRQLRIRECGTDAPWLWKSGDFPCEVEQLQRSIPPSTELVLGRIEETFPRWLSGIASAYWLCVRRRGLLLKHQAILKSFESSEVRSFHPFISSYFDEMLQYLTPRSTGEFAAVMNNDSHNVVTRGER